MGRSFVGILALLAGCGAQDFPPPPGRCSPGQSGACPEGYICCSDDPAALDLNALDAAALPNYDGHGGTGVPLFSAGNNSLSASGMCIAAGAVPIEGTLGEDGAQGCPIPCNPSWSEADLDAVCGGNTICCQMVELEPEDCVFDSSLGDVGCWRPVTGTDIIGLGQTGLTRWESTEHATHQDPGGVHCKAFVAGVPQEVLDDEGLTAQDLERACLRRLGVADTRGFCLGKSPSVTACPLDDPGYRDACEQRNDEQQRGGCG
jgi:hypothetical protein